MQDKFIKLAHGSGGREMGELISFIRKHISYKGNWKYTDEDSAALEYTNQRRWESEYTRKNSGIPARTTDVVQSGGLRPPGAWAQNDAHINVREGKYIVFTTDAFVVDPIFFTGGNIGDLAFNGTLNDLLMQGAKPLGISLALVIEEGFSIVDLEKILKSIGAISRNIKIPIATGDTKVVPKGAIDKIMITTSGVGLAEKIISDRGLKPGDKIIASGTLGDHGAALLAERFNYKTSLRSDTKPLIKEMSIVRKYLTAAKDPTRGGIASVMNELAEKSKVKIILDEDKIPISKETSAICRLLGISKYALASEGGFVAGVNAENAQKVIRELNKFNKSAIIMGEVKKGRGVYIKNNFGEKRLEYPEGVLAPRIC
ncbi:MAG: hydrogenase expression/formation protein HypE [bacterium]